MKEGEDPVLTVIPADIVRNLISVIPAEYGGDLMMSSPDYMYAGPLEYQAMADVTANRAKKNVSAEQALEMFGIRKLAEYDGDPVVEIDVSFPDEETERRFISEMDERLDYVSTSASYGRNGRTSGELTCRGTSKATGAVRSTELLGGDMKNTYAFGDSMNDASVLKVCRYGIAMGNSPQELKDLADYITDDIAQDGVVTAMKHFGII